MRQKCTDAKNILNMGKPKWNKPTQVIRVLLTLTEVGKVDIIIHSTLDFLVKYTARMLKVGPPTCWMPSGTFTRSNPAELKHCGVRDTTTK